MISEQTVGILEPPFLPKIPATAGLTKICHLFTTVGWTSAENLAARLSVRPVLLAQKLLTGLDREDIRHSAGIYRRTPQVDEVTVQTSH